MNLEKTNTEPVQRDLWGWVAPKKTQKPVFTELEKTNFLKLKSSSFWFYKACYFCKHTQHCQLYGTVLNCTIRDKDILFVCSTCAMSLKE